MNTEELYEKTVEEVIQEAQNDILIPENFKKHLEGNNLTDDKVANLLAIHLGPQHLWNNAAVNELTRIYIQYKNQQGLIDKGDNIRSKHKEFIEALIKAARKLAPVQNGIEETPNGYVLWKSTKDGQTFPTQLTNFIFKNIRTVKISDTEEAPLVDLKLGGEIRKNIILPASICSERRKLDPYLSGRINKARIYTYSASELDDLIQYVAEQAEEIVPMEDYTGMFFHKKSNLYYYINLDKDGRPIYIKPQEMKDIADDLLVQILGTRHKTSQSRMRMVREDSSWYPVATEMLELVPSLLTHSKSLIMLAWHFAALISPWIRQKFGKGMPILSVFGEPGSGKTTTLRLISMYFGKIGEGTASLSHTPQPVAQALSCTNAFAMLTTEYNPKSRYINEILTMLKNLYEGEPHRRGKKEGLNEEWPLTSPLIIQGNSQVDNEAVQSRSVQILVQKANQNPHGQQIARIWAAGEKNSAFIEGYLYYLINNQSKWQQWDEQALGYYSSITDPRQQDILRVMLIGLMMIQDLRIILELTPYSENDINNFIQEIDNNFTNNQMQAQHLGFIEFLQNYHTHPDYVRKRIHCVDDGIHKFHKKTWMDEYRNYLGNTSNDVNFKVLEQGLKDLGEEAVTVDRNLSIHKHACRTITIDPHKLEKATGGKFPAALWNDPFAEGKALEKLASDIEEYAKERRAEAEESSTPTSIN